MTESILSQERTKAVREYAAQLSQVSNDELDEAYERGRYAELTRERTPQWRWWAFGVLCGIVLSLLVWGFYP